MDLSGSDLERACYLSRNFLGSAESYWCVVPGRTMDPENLKPGAAEPKGSEPKSMDAQRMDSAGSQRTDDDPVNPKIEESTREDAKTVQAKIGAGMMDERRFAQVSRRELLKVAPVLALGAFAIPSFQAALLKKGLGFSDWASEWLLPPGPLVPA